MKLSDMIKFEAIDLTQIIITIGLTLIIIYAFKSQLNNFVGSLQDRPIKVTMSGSETTIELDAPVTVEPLAEPISNPIVSQQELDDWEQLIDHTDDVGAFQKSSFNSLYNELTHLTPDGLTVINYIVNNPNIPYFNDKAMLRYLSMAAEKIRYLAFYKNEEFVGVIEVTHVIAGLSKNIVDYSDFGHKLKNGEWENFPHLINRAMSFNQIPSVKALYTRLNDTGLPQIPLVKNNLLTGFLSYKSISDELYAQISSSQ